MKILLVYYSKTGTTKKIAQEIASKIKCDLEEIHDTQNRLGFGGMISALNDAIFRRKAAIKKPGHNPASYDLVVIGTPVWGSVTPAVRAYLSQYAGKFKKVAFFCTMGGFGSIKTFKDMEILSGRVPLSVMGLNKSNFADGSSRQIMQNFTNGLKNIR